MKRSEALVKLKEKYKDLLRRTIRSESCLNAMVSELLSFVEKEIGMLPPKHPKKRVTEISLLRPAYMWEDEDETK